MSGAPPDRTPGLAEWTLGLADDRLVLGHRLSEWCGFAPILEEELALANVALDLIGQAQIVLVLAGGWEGRARSADDLAFLRDSREYRNVLLVEQPNGDFADTMVRQLLFDAFDVPLLEALTGSSEPALADFAGKAVKEARYHLRHSREWVVRLGDGTDESHQRAQGALNRSYRLTPELFEARRAETELVAQGAVPRAESLRPAWAAELDATLLRAGLVAPELAPGPGPRGRQGLHSEHLGHMLAEMQVLPRTFPGTQW